MNFPLSKDKVWWSGYGRNDSSEAFNKDDVLSAVQGLKSELEGSRLTLTVEECDFLDAMEAAVDKWFPFSKDSEVLSAAHPLVEREGRVHLPTESSNYSLDLLRAVELSGFFIGFTSPELTDGKGHEEAKELSELLKRLHSFSLESYNEGMSAGARPAVRSRGECSKTQSGHPSEEKDSHAVFMYYGEMENGKIVFKRGEFAIPLSRIESNSLLGHCKAEQQTSSPVDSPSVEELKTQQKPEGGISNECKGVKDGNSITKAMQRIEAQYDEAFECTIQFLNNKREIEVYKLGLQDAFNILNQERNSQLSEALLGPDSKKIIDSREKTGVSNPPLKTEGCCGDSNRALCTKSDMVETAAGEVSCSKTYGSREQTGTYVCKQCGKETRSFPFCSMQCKLSEGTQRTADRCCEQLSEGARPSPSIKKEQTGVFIGTCKCGHTVDCHYINAIYSDFHFCKGDRFKCQCKMFSLSQPNYRTGLQGSSPAGVADTSELSAVYNDVHAQQSDVKDASNKAVGLQVPDGYSIINHKEPAGETPLTFHCACCGLFPTMCKNRFKCNRDKDGNYPPHKLVESTDPNFDYQCAICEYKKKGERK